MSAQVNVNWSKSYSLDRHLTSAVYRGFVDLQPTPKAFHNFAPPYLQSEKIKSYQNSNNIESVPPNSFLHTLRLRRNLEESRKAFLNFCETKDDENELPDVNKENFEQKKAPTRKISFKCKKTPTYRRSTVGSNKIGTLNPNTVADLTLKFNELSEKVSILEQPKFARLVRRVNSLKTAVHEEGVNKKVVRKPSVKIKPVQTVEELNKVKLRNLKNLINVNSDLSVNVKTEAIDAATAVHAQKVQQQGMNVRATIEIFERRSSQSCTPEAEYKSIVKGVEKPKVPEKSPNIKTKDLVVKNGIKKLKKLDSTETTSSNESNITKVNEIKTELEDEVQILNIPLVMPRRCDSMYETLTLRRISPIPPLIITESKSESTIAINSYTPVKPNSSFLWRQKSQEMQNSESYDWKSTYDTVETTMVTEKLIPPAIPPRPTVLNLSKSPKLIFKKKMPLPTEIEEKIYEELSANVVNGSTDGDYEYCQSQSKYEDIEHKSDDGYECFDSVVSTPKTTKTEEIYETLPYNNKEQLKVPPRKQGEPLPPRPASRNSYCTIQNSENISNCYESIYNIKCEESISNNYESIYACNTHNEHWDSASNRDSMISSDQQSNSLYSRSLSGWTTEEVYNGKATSDLSGSDKSDEWIDISDNEENSKGTSSFVIIREKTRNKKTAGWSQKIRDQWNKSHSLEEDNSDSDHHYESLYNGEEYRDNECFDSFDSDTESENSFSKNQNDSGVDMCNSQLPDPPSQSYGLTRLAVSAGKHMKKLRRNWSLTKNDITKSLTRMAKRKSRTDLTNDAMTKSREDNNASPASTKPQISSPIMCERNSAMLNVAQEFKLRHSEANNVYQNVQYTGKDNTELTENYEKVRTSSLSKSKFLNKFRRSMLISTESANEITQSLGNKTKSTFYLTDPIDVDGQMDVTKSKGDSINSSVSPSLLRHSKSFPQRPQSPPPPVPVDANQNIDSKSARSTKRSTSWYAECGLFRNSETNLLRNSENSNSLNGRRPNTSWYAEIGLYQTSTSTPSSSSAENSGSAININVKPSESINSTENKDVEVKSESDYYNDSIGSCNSNTIIEKDSNISPDIQLRLQDEPLYQFYDAAVLESVCHDGTSDFDYDGYEEVGEKLHLETNLTRPSAMQLISPSKNGFTVVRTLWCEIPEVINSTVLSTLSLHQKKIQEAKFEMITSEASYLNSLNVLTDYFITNLNNSDLITNEEKTLLFSRIPAVKRCSEKLLIDLEKCWQGNILLHGICDIVKKHAEEHFDVYISYCENQILLDSTLRKMRERNSCSELLKQLECSSACQSLTLYSFLMLPMQRITRWPLLVDAVLKRLSPQDDEYLTCQCTLAAINKVVTQCNEAARLMERETEVKKIASQIEFPRGIPSIKVASNSRWLVRSGVLTQMLARADDTKLTFGKRFSKVPLHLFLFNDLLLVTKHRSDDCYIVLHYCFRSYVELNESDVIGSFPIKDSQGRHLLFLTILENHDGKTVEMLLSCNSESDKERWIEALTPPKSEDPDETLYECWDCPQVTAIHSYNASQPDELALSRGDVINVIRKMADGWYHGERIRDGQTGWFPANYTIEIANPHVRARNLKQRYRLLALSGNYLKSK